jgi:hypothetical protein
MSPGSLRMRLKGRLVTSPPRAAYCDLGIAAPRRTGRSRSSQRESPVSSRFPFRVTSLFRSPITTCRYCLQSITKDNKWLDLFKPPPFRPSPAVLRWSAIFRPKTSLVVKIHPPGYTGRSGSTVMVISTECSIQVVVVRSTSFIQIDTHRWSLSGSLTTNTVIIRCCCVSEVPISCGFTWCHFDGQPNGHKMSPIWPQSPS